MSSGSCLSTKAMRLAYNKSLVSYCHHTIAGYLHAHFPPPLVLERLVIHSMAWTASLLCSRHWCTISN